MGWGVSGDAQKNVMEYEFDWVFCLCAIGSFYGCVGDR